MIHKQIVKLSKERMEGMIVIVELSTRMLTLLAIILLSKVAYSNIQIKDFLISLIKDIAASVVIAMLDVAFWLETG